MQRGVHRPINLQVDVVRELSSVSYSICSYFKMATPLIFYYYSYYFMVDFIDVPLRNFY